jgi:hypothetical protein
MSHWLEHEPARIVWLKHARSGVPLTSPSDFILVLVLVLSRWTEDEVLEVRCKAIRASYTAFQRSSSAILKPSFSPSKFFNQAVDQFIYFSKISSRNFRPDPELLLNIIFAPSPSSRNMSTSRLQQLLCLLAFTNLALAGKFRFSIQELRVVEPRDFPKTTSC